MKKALSVIANDLHIKQDNIDSIKSLVKQMIDLAKKEKADFICFLGDIFQSRQAQPLAVLKCFEEILEMVSKSGLWVYIIPGNHDKTNYESDDSFLDAFSYNPSNHLFREYGVIKDDDNSLNLHFLPFYSNDKWIEKFNEIPKLEGKNVLLSHIAVNVSINNDGTKVESPISPTLLKDFDLVLLGHYHNSQKISSNIFHLPSIQQNNYGENSEKGFTVLYDDLSTKFVKSKFKEFITLKADLNKLSKKEFNEIVENINTKECFVRLEVSGEESKVNAVNKNELKSLGFEVKLKSNEIDTSIEFAENGEIVEFTDSSILQEFKTFCEKEGYGFSERELNYLNKTLIGL